MRGTVIHFQFQATVFKLPLVKEMQRHVLASDTVSGECKAIQMFSKFPMHPMFVKLFKLHYLRTGQRSRDKNKTFRRSDRGGKAHRQKDMWSAKAESMKRNQTATGVTSFVFKPT